MNLRRIVALAAMGGLLCGATATVAGAQAPDPPDAPEPENGARAESNAPMFRLRNDRPDTPPPPGVRGPDPPSSPQVEDPAGNRGSKRDSHPGTSPEDPAPSTDREAPSPRASDTSVRDPSTDAGGDKSSRSPEDTKREGSRTEGKSEPAPEKSPPLPSRREKRYTAGETFRPVESAGFDSPLASDSPAAAPGLMSVSEAPEAPPRDPLPEWWLLGGAGVVLLGLGGLFIWMRRPRVRVVESDSLDTYEYFQKKFEAASLAPGRGGEEDPTGRTGGRRRVVTPRTPPDGDPSAEEGEPWKRGDDELRRAGIDPSYRPLLKRYFDEGLSPREIARSLDIGEGEVGLVLDLARRNFTRDRTPPRASSNGKPTTSPKT